MLTEDKALVTKIWLECIAVCDVSKLLYWYAKMFFLKGKLHMIWNSSMLYHNYNNCVNYFALTIKCRRYPWSWNAQGFIFCMITAIATVLSYLEIFFLLPLFTAPGHKHLNDGDWYEYLHIWYSHYCRISRTTPSGYSGSLLWTILSSVFVVWSEKNRKTVDRKESVNQTCPYIILHFMWEKTLWMCSKHLGAFCLPMPNAIKSSPHATNKRTIHIYLPTLWNHHILHATRAEPCRFSAANVCTPGLIEFVFVLPIHTVDYLASYKQSTMFTNKVPKGASRRGHR